MDKCDASAESQSLRRMRTDTLSLDQHIRADGRARLFQRTERRAPLDQARRSAACRQMAVMRVQRGGLRSATPNEWVQAFQKDTESVRPAIVGTGNTRAVLRAGEQNVFDVHAAASTISGRRT